MKKNIIFTMCLLVFTLTMNSQNFVSSNFIIEANGWYVFEASTNSFSNTIDRFTSQGLTLVEYDIPQSTSPENTLAQKKDKRNPIPGHSLDWYSNSKLLEGRLRNYIQNISYDTTKHESKWYHGLTRTAGSLFGSIGTL